MPHLCYGPTLRFELDAESTRLVADAIGAHASRGGWVSFTDSDAKEWAILVTPGVPIWIEAGGPSR